jgi:hypothetical protein
MLEAACPRGKRLALIDVPPLSFPTCYYPERSLNGDHHGQQGTARKSREAQTEEGEAQACAARFDVLRRDDEELRRQEEPQLAAHPPSPASDAPERIWRYGPWTQAGQLQLVLVLGAGTISREVILGRAGRPESLLVAGWERSHAARRAPRLERQDWACSWHRRAKLGANRRLHPEGRALAERWVDPDAATVRVEDCLAMRVGSSRFLRAGWNSAATHVYAHS